MPATKSTANSSTAAIASSSAGQLRWLHLSDIHFWGKNDWRDEAARRKLITLLKDKFADGSLPKPDLIFCTGDIAQGETKPNEMVAQYESAQKFFDEVLQVCGLDKERLFLVPGNHDVNRNSVNEFAQDGLRRAKIDKIADSWAKRDKVFGDALERMDEYAHFISTYLPHQHPSDDEKARLCYRQHLEINGLRVGIAGFNSAWSCYDDHDQNKLWMAAEWQFNAADTAFHDKTDLRIGLMHHPVSWLQAEESTLAKKRIRSQFHFWLHGHEHDAWVTPTDSEVVIAAGAVNAKNDSEFGINLVDLQLTEGKGRVHLFAYSTQDNEWQIKPAQKAPLGVRQIDCVKPTITAPKYPSPLEASALNEIPHFSTTSDANTNHASASAEAPTDCAQHPSQLAMQALDETIATAFGREEATPLRIALARIVRAAPANSVSDICAKLDAEPALEMQMLSIQKALQEAAKQQTIANKPDGEPHPTEQAAAALYMRAALRRANLAAIELGCPRSTGLTIVPAESDVLIAILAAALHGEIHPIGFKPQAEPRSKMRGKPGAENFIEFAEGPLAPLKTEAELTHALAMRIDKRYHHPLAAQNAQELAARQEELKLTIAQSQVLDRKYFRGIVGEKADAMLQDEAKLRELHQKLGLPFTRIAANEEVNVKEFLGVSVAAIDHLFLQFLELLERIKLPSA